MSSHQIPSSQKAVEIQRQGGIEEVLEVRDNVKIPELKPDDILIKVEYSGVNFIDTYQRKGLYKMATPCVLGNECAGTLVAIGSNVKPEEYGYKIGDKVATYGAGSCYAQYARSTAKNAFKIPSHSTTREAAAAMIQGMTALTFITEAYEVKKDDWILVHAAAGGLGLILCQLCKLKGAHVIGTTSTAEKAEMAKKAGAEHVILYHDGNYDEVGKKVKKLTPNGEGVHGIFDGVGAATFESNFLCLRRKATFVSVGNASGAVPPFAPLKLNPGNYKFCRPSLTHYVTLKEEFHAYAKELFDYIDKKQLNIAIHKEYPFTTEGVRQAHTDIESRGTTGKLLLAVDPQ